MAVIGIDLGGTKISAVLMNEKGKVLGKTTRITNAQNGKNAVLESVVESINSVKTPEVNAVGIGIPGFCKKDNKIEHMPHIPCLVGINLKKEIEKRTALKVVVANDADCFVLAESKYGAARNSKNIIGVVIGTGVGAGLILNDVPYHGSCGWAGEVGHTKLVVSADGSSASVESLIAGPSLVKRYNVLSGKSAVKVTDIDKKDPNFKKVYAEFVNYTGVFFANLINTFNPDCIVVGGGISNLDFYRDVEKKVKTLALPALAKACSIKKNKLGDDAGVLGAAMLAF